MNKLMQATGALLIQPPIRSDRPEAAGQGSKKNRKNELARLQGLVTYMKKDGRRKLITGRKIAIDDLRWWAEAVWDSSDPHARA